MADSLIPFTGREADADQSGQKKVRRGYHGC